MNYKELKERQQKEVNAFPIVFAFDDEQFKAAMNKLGLSENDTDKVYSIPGYGIIRKTDSKAFNDLFDKIDKELQDEIDADPTGENFIYSMFYYELNNHEFGYTLDVEDTLDALGYTYDDLLANPKLMIGLEKAKKEILSDN